MGEKEQLFLTRAMELVKVEEMSEREIQPQNPTAISGCRQATQTGAKTSLWKFQEKQRIYVILQYLPLDSVNYGEGRELLTLKLTPP